MSTNKTQNYNLHSWVPEDDFLRSEFNDNFTSLDTALKTLSTALAAETTAREAAVSAETQARASAISAEQSARQSAVTTLTSGKAEIVAGFYEGDGTAERTITLGFQPKAVLLMQNIGRTWVSNSNLDSAYGGLFLPDHPLVCRNSGTGPKWLPTAEIVSTGFKVHESGLACANENGNVYHYIAVK